LSDDEGSWAPFGPSGDDDPPSTTPPKLVPAPDPTPAPESAPAPAPEEESPPSEPPPPELPPAAAFEPPVAQPLPSLPGLDAPALGWPDPDPPAAPPPPAADVPPVGTWPPPGPPAFGTPAKVASNATASLVLGVVGLVFCPIIASIAAISLGTSAKKEIRENPGLGGEGMASWGIGLGIVGLAWGVLILVLIAAGASTV
jgi:hypothetical protein